MQMPLPIGWCNQWRSEEAAIMVGTTTALQDDPSLTTRLVTGKKSCTFGKLIWI